MNNLTGFGIVVREVVGVTDDSLSVSSHIVYAGDLSEYKGGVGAFDEGDCHIFRYPLKLVNLTPHDIVVYDGVEFFTIPASGTVARVAVSQEEVHRGLGVPVVRNAYGEVENLPEPQPDTYFIVSSLVLEALRKEGCTRTDILAPDTGPTAIRDEQGRIAAVRRFVTL